MYFRLNNNKNTYKIVKIMPQKAELGKSASPQIRNCGLTKKVADMRTCRLWQFKLCTCGYGLFLILVRNSASFVQVLKFLSIFVKYLCFYPVKPSNIKNQFNFFEFKFGKNIKIFEFRLTKVLSLLFDLISFFLLACCFFEFGTTTDFFRHYRWAQGRRIFP